MMAKRLQAEEREELSDAEKASLLLQFIETRRKFFAVKRAEEKINKPPTKAQQRKLIEQRANSDQEISKRVGEDMEHEQTKKQKLDKDKEQTKLKLLTEINSKEDEVPIDAIPLATKHKIIGWNIYKEGKNSYWNIIRVGGKS
ncbi:hypothetical protein Tco_0639648 [Tanacetum coccineum]